jgi:DNA polymerase V
MQKVDSFENDRIYKIDIDVKPLLLPLFSYRVSCGFPSPAEDYIEERLDLLHELVKHPDSTYMWRAGGDSMRGRMIDVGTVLIFDKMVEPKSGDIAAVRIGGDLCVRELLIDQDGKRFLIARNENYQPIEVTEEMDVEILGKVIWSITKH